MASNPEELLKKIELQEIERSILEQEKFRPRQIPHTAQVDLNIDPAEIPLNTAKAQQLYEDLTSAYGSSFDDSEIIEMIPPEARAALNPIPLLSLAMKKGKLIQFVGGILRFEEISRTTTISKMGIGEQQVSSVVEGSSDEAMLLCKNLCLSLWRASGIEKRWEDIEKHVSRVRYKSTTVADLPFPLIDLFDARFQGFLNEDVAGEQGYGKMMGLRPVKDEIAESQRNEKQVVSHCRQIQIVVSVLNNVTGQSEDNSLNFLIRSRSDANRSQVLVTSELPTSKHMGLVQQVTSRMSE